MLTQVQLQGRKDDPCPFDPSRDSQINHWLRLFRHMSIKGGLRCFQNGTAQGEVESMVSLGDRVWVKVTDVTEEGKVELSMKVVDQETGKEIVSEAPAAEERTSRQLKRILDDKNENEDEEDEIKLHEAGFKRRYYLKKFHVDINLEPDFPRRIVQSYIEGLVWVLAYYYQGCASWSWFYPFHYAPFASDFTELSSLKLRFRRGEPYRPLEQLMAVLPPRSSHALPEGHAKLMLDSKSAIADFYPKDFAIDMNGARMSWMGIALMPFIDSDRLISTVRPLEEKLSEQEKHRNLIHPNRVFVSSTHPNFEAMSKLAASVPATIGMQEAVNGRSQWMRHRRRNLWFNGSDTVQ